MPNDEPVGGFPAINTWRRPDVPDPGGGAVYGVMIETLRGFLDRLAAAKPDEATLGELAGDLGSWSRRLEPLAVEETQQIFSRRHDLVGRGQTMSPPFTVIEGDDTAVRGRVTFGRYFLGGNGAVHGGAIPLLFDEVMGRLANAGNRARARTAYLNTDYRSITPIGVELEIKAWFVFERGRKRLLRGELRHGETLCAETEGLFVMLKPGQP
jgi:acyl-coenzyme A thioesterase PaaI-like protein